MDGEATYWDSVTQLCKPKWAYTIEANGQRMICFFSLNIVDMLEILLSSDNFVCIVALRSKFSFHDFCK